MIFVNRNVNRIVYPYLNSLYLSEIQGGKYARTKIA